WFVVSGFVGGMFGHRVVASLSSNSGYWARMALAAVHDPKKIRLHGQYPYRRRRTQVFLVSYPKTGRTWLRVMIGRAIVRAYHVQDAFMLDTYGLTRRAGLPRAMFTHDGPFGLSSGASYPTLRFRADLYAGKKVAFLARDVRDALVSSYFQETRRTVRFRGSIAAFVRDDGFGARKIVTFYTLWYRHRHIPREFLLLRYEELSRDAARVLARVLAFMEAPVSPSIQAEAVTYGSFENMRLLEEGNAL